MGSAFTQQYSFVRLIVVYRHTALSVPRALLVLWFVGYLRSVEFIFNVRCGDAVAYRGGVGVFKPPQIPKALQNGAKINQICENC